MSDQQQTDPGFSRTYDPHLKRLINKDGSYNVIKTGKVDGFRDVYNYLLHISWVKFFGIVTSYFIIVNLGFAVLYYSIGIDALSIKASGSAFQDFIQCFYFSTQTFTTVGYGLISPIGVYSSLLASFEALFGLLSFSLATGLMYGRFSKPDSKIIFSDNALISPFKDNQKGLMFRLVNQRNSNLSNVEATVLLSLFDSNGDGSNPKRKFFRLDLEYDKIRFFPSTWTIVHPLENNSPLITLNEKDYKDKKVEISIFIEAFDENLSQIVHSRHSYMSEEIIMNAKFKPSYTIDEDGFTRVDINTFGDYNKTK